MPEHQRREAAGISAVTNPALLDRLMNLPVATAVTDPVIWEEMAGLGPEIIERRKDGASITRYLASPLRIEDVVVDAAAGQELGAVQDASLFAGYARRWVATARDPIPDAAVLEAKLAGVGVLDMFGKVLLSAERPVSATTNGWSWLLQEKVYRRWLNPTISGSCDGEPSSSH